MHIAEDVTPAVGQKREPPPGVFLVLGVVMVPGLIALVSPWGVEPGTKEFIYAAFAAVVGQTVAVLTAAGVFAAAIIRRSSIGRVVISGVIALVVTVTAFSTASTFAEQIVRGFAI
jgi:hypothetical protein